ncbi:hypothetical protein DFH06DRAFT_1321318 [Mycena polygramma]|nr:hypothetical protein DFH06DRAFT_1321318 [Mycena polygramma]
MSLTADRRSVWRPREFYLSEKSQPLNLNLDLQGLSTPGRGASSGSDFPIAIGADSVRDVTLALCDKYYNTQESFEVHKVIHEGFPCTVCKVSFLTQEALEDHYRGKAPSIHPKCPRCYKGFFNTDKLTEASRSHFKIAHPKVVCPQPCGVELFEEDLEDHYRESAHHPMCLICRAGLKDDVAYREHGATEHPEHRCTTCERQFTSTDELADHFVASAAHPNCLQCKLGFVDDAALDEHGATEHPEHRCTTCERQFTCTDELTDHFVKSPAHPKCFQCKLGFADDAALNEHYLATHALTRQIAVTEPHQDFLAIEGIPTGPRLAPSALPRPGREVEELWTSTKNQVVGPAPLDAGVSNALSSTTFFEAPWGLKPVSGEATNIVRRRHPSSETPKARKIDQDSWMSLSSRVSGAGSATSSNSAKTISPQSSTSSLHSGCLVELSDSANSGRSGSVVAEPLHDRVIFPKTPHRCMVCSGVCMDPTATMCGHLFCNQCITKRILQAPACPKCNAPTLLYSIHRMHFDD